MNENRDAITLRLEGTRAVRGVVLTDFEKFIERFMGALRDFDRDRHGMPTKKSGAPEARAAHVTAFRLVAFRPGSGIATIEPELGKPGEDTEELFDAEPMQVDNLRSMLASVEKEADLPEPVLESLEQACRTFGEDGSISVRFDESDADDDAVLIDAPRLERIRAAMGITPPEQAEAISGRLHRVDFEPDRIAIRTAAGVDWACDYPPSLEPQIELLVNRIVRATGSGTLQSPLRGTMRIEQIEGIEQGVQVDLFSAELVSVADLAAKQGIDGPQGLDNFAVPEWTDEDDAYLAALTED